MKDLSLINACVSFPLEGPCLIRGYENLANEPNLRVPVTAQPFLTIHPDTKDFENYKLLWQNGCPIQGSVGSIVPAKVVGVCAITKNIRQVRKSKQELQIEFDERDENAGKVIENCDAGDSFYFIFPNPNNEVEYILNRLDLLEKADLAYHISTLDNVDLSNSNVPTYVPQCCSPRHLLTYCLDIRRAPGRPFLRVLADYVTDAAQKRRILELCSVQGTQEFNKFIRQNSISFVDFLMAFPSCHPPLARLIELLPRLLPRPFTVASHKSLWGNRLRFIYSLLRQPLGDGVQFERYGLCSGWLRTLGIGDIIKVMIGPGTGVAPFIAFLHKIQSRIETEQLSNGRNVPRYLFYGSSNLDEEFIFREELEKLQKNGVVTQIFLCESRPDENLQLTLRRPKYVQDALKDCEFITEAILSQDWRIFACGDVKNMSKELWKSLSEIICKKLGDSPANAMELLKRLRAEERLIEDVWS